MLPLSASDAISPAWEHTRRLLIVPRSWRLLLKIGFVVLFAGMGGTNLRSSNNNGHLSKLHHLPHMPDPGPVLAAFAALVAVLVVFCLLFWFVFFYISSRLQFVLMEIVLRSDTEVAPIWRRYGPATWRWMALRLVLVVAALLCIAPVLIPAVIQFIHAMPAPGQPPADMSVFLGTILGLFATVFFVALIFSVLKILLHDFGLPSMALESTPMFVTVKRVVQLFRAEPGQAVLYIVLRCIMGIAADIITITAIVIGALIACIPFGGVGLILWLALRHTGMGGEIVMGVLLVALALAYACLVIGALVMILGLSGVFFQAYALYFLGGRYPLVGIHLEPFLPKPVPPYTARIPPPAAA